MERTTRRYGLGSRVFATDPWTVIRRSVKKRCPAATLTAALALLEQSEDYFRAAESGVKAAKPLLLYYCYMNLAKAYVLATRQRNDVNDAMHGLRERRIALPNGTELANAYLDAFPTNAPPQPINVFDELLRAISHQGLPPNATRLHLAALMPQIVPGHRLWSAGATPGTKERFVSLEKIEFCRGANSTEIWLRLFLFADDLKRIDLSHQDLLDQTDLNQVLCEVACDEQVNRRRLICLEQIDVVAYEHRPSDSVPRLVETLRHRLWRTVLATPPYRKYYLYPAPAAERSEVLPQILSIYAVTYCLGSITRYRPHHFDAILESSFGPFIEAFLNDQPKQFLYLMASEFAETEVTKAAIV